MSTPGRRRALRALAARKRKNVTRVAEGEMPIVAGKNVPAKQLGLTKTKAQRIMRERAQRS